MIWINVRSIKELAKKRVYVAWFQLKLKVTVLLSSWWKMPRLEPHTSPEAEDSHANTFEAETHNVRADIIK